MSISDIIMLLLPIMLMIVLWGFKWIEQRLPPAKRAELDYYANKAVKFVEQTCKGTSTQKKNAAITMIYAFFKAINRPAPAMIFIDAAIEEVVWMINQGKFPKEFMMPDDKPTINTGPIKPILPDPGRANGMIRIQELSPDQIIDPNTAEKGLGRFPDQIMPPPFTPDPGEDVSWNVSSSKNNCITCLTNAEDSPRPYGTPFNSGDTEPPIHDGCGCFLTSGIKGYYPIHGYSRYDNRIFELSSRY